MNEEELKTLANLNKVLKAIAPCRNAYLATAITSLTKTLGGLLTALTAALLQNAFSYNVFASTALLVSLISAYTIIMFYTFRKTFTYTFKLASLRGWKPKISDAFIFPLTIGLSLLVSKYFNLPFLIMASPFLALGAVKVASLTLEGLVSGVVLISLTMLGITVPLNLVPIVASISYSISSLFEVLINLEEAERCVQLKAQ